MEIEIELSEQIAEEMKGSRKEVQEKWSARRN